jgi:hypothetical protein
MMYLLCFYVPQSHLEAVKDAVFAAGAGRIGDYEQCSWQSTGQGQFQPLAGSQPFIGSHDTLERVPETKVEMVCPQVCLASAVTALLDAHPYEEPAWHVVSILADAQTIASLAAQDAPG